MVKIRKEYTIFLIIISFFAFLLCLQQKYIKKLKLRARKERGLFFLMNQWIGLKQDNQQIETYFRKNNYQRIAVYGMGFVGMRLIKELRNTNLNIIYGIDQNAANISSDLKLLTLEDELPEVDVIIVTVLGSFQEIYDKLSTKIKCDIVAIEDIINEV
ncbi:MAG: hypothetical protein HFI14_09780 [Lachnospiraceae bacterium]|nr:hypothetical protein [Lachnospiraceae bacterium]